MKNKTSYLSLIAHQTLGKVLVWTIAVFVIQMLQFRSSVCNFDTYYYALSNVQFIIPLFLIGVGGIYLILMLDGSLNGQSRTGYFWMRLSVSMREQMMLSAIYYIGCMLIFLAVEAVLIPVSWQFFCLKAEATVHWITYYRGVYSYNFFHALCPLADLSVWIRNGFYIGTLTFEILTNNWQYRMVGRTRGIHMGLFSMIWFGNASLGETGFDILICIFLAFIMVYDLLQLRLFTIEREESLVTGDQKKKEG